jgi:hypothetical protein
MCYTAASRRCNPTVPAITSTAHEQGEVRHMHGWQRQQCTGWHTTCRLCISYRGELIVAILFQHRLSFL